jgi:hypothetical protein
VRYQIHTPGFRTREITLVTTLLDAEVYRVADLAELYRRRWQLETALAQLKTIRQMDVLHCKTVPGVLKELTVFAIVYNLVRLVMGPSATLHFTKTGQEPNGMKLGKAKRRGYGKFRYLQFSDFVMLTLFRA